MCVRIGIMHGYDVGDVLRDTYVPVWRCMCLYSCGYATCMPGWMDMWTYTYTWIDTQVDAYMGMVHVDGTHISRDDGYMYMRTPYRMILRYLGT